jgi:hypothetical protein
MLIFKQAPAILANKESYISHFGIKKYIKCHFGYHLFNGIRFER